MRQFKGAEDE
jgi:hypothetical protein